MYQTSGVERRMDYPVLFVLNPLVQLEKQLLTHLRGKLSSREHFMYVAGDKEGTLAVRYERLLCSLGNNTRRRHVAFPSD